jgi:hypothetical protein
VDMAADGWVDSLKNAICRPCAFAFGFNGMGYDICVGGGESVYNVFEIPFISFLVDHPAYHIERIKNNINNFIFTYVDRTHMDYINKYFETPKQCAFVPHGGCMAATALKENTARNIDVLFAGSYEDYEKIREEWHSYSSATAKLFDRCAEYALAHEDVALYNVLADVLEEFGISLGHELLRESTGIIMGIDQYVRYYRRRSCLDMLSKLGVQVHCYGTGWENMNLKNRRNIMIHGQVGFTYILYLMQKAKIVVNVSPTFIDGSHERVFSAMLNGAVCVTDYSGYLAEQFEDNKDIVFFSWENIGELPDKIGNLLEDGDRLSFISNNGQRKASRNHTWEKRAEDIAALAEKHFNRPTSGRPNE